MTSTAFRYGFRITADCSTARRLIDWAAAWRGYAGCDARAEVSGESYLSAFTFGEDFRHVLESTGSTRGFSGACWAPFIWFDIDRPHDLTAALEAARRLALVLVDGLDVAECDLLAFFSGAKGFHLGAPTALWSPERGDSFHRDAKRFAELVAERAERAIDTGIYDRVRAFRAPNSRHPRTGLHKRRLSLDELMGLSVEGVLRLAQRPEPFDVEPTTRTSPQAAQLWRQAAEEVQRRTEQHAERKARGDGPRIHLATRRFLAEGAEPGERNTALFAAARNLADFGCPKALAHALLGEPARDCGFTPSEARRVIDNGWRFILAGGNE